MNTRRLAYLFIILVTITVIYLIALVTNGLSYLKDDSVPAKEEVYTVEYIENGDIIVSKGDEYRRVPMEVAFFNEVTGLLPKDMLILLLDNDNEVVGVKYYDEVGEAQTRIY